MDKYEELKRLVRDYVDHMDNINELKIECNEKELDLLKKEMVCFNLLQRNLYKMEELDVVPEDQQPV